MSSRLAALFFALATALLALTTITAAHRYVIHDGPPVVAYGFPVPWHAANGAVSLARDVDVRAFFFDLVFYAIPAVMLLLRLPLLRRRPRPVLAAAVFLTLVGAVGVLVSVGLDPVWRSAAPS